MLKAVGTSGKLYVIWLNMARFVPSSIVSKETSSSIVRSTGSIGSTTTGTSAVSLTSWYVSTAPKLVRGADELYVIDEVMSGIKGLYF